MKRPTATTGQVLDRLNSLGLTVSTTQLDNDTRDGFLPERIPEGVGGGRGRSGQWQPWMVQRAERLYRLRRIKDPDGQPSLSGDVLRTLLFLGDGHGWSTRVKDAALRGYDKSIAATLAPVRKYTKQHRENEAISYALEANNVNLSPGDKNAIGMLQNGEALDEQTMRPLYDIAKDMGLLHGFAPFVASFAKLFGIAAGEGEPFIAQLLFSIVLGATNGVTEGNAGLASMLRPRFENLSDEAAMEGLPKFRRFIRDVRGFIHRSATAENRRSFSTSPVTMFGKRQRDLEREFRETRAPRRITPAQSLALFVGISIVSDQMLNEFFAQLGSNMFFFTSLLQMILAPKKAS